MSKYNLTDIYEQFKAGDKFSTDFDYDGMLKAGLEAGVDTDLNTLKALSDSFEDVNYHRENSHLQKAIDALENGEPMDEVSMLFGDFHAEIKQTMKEQGMDIEPTLGKFMASKMSSMMNEDELQEAPTRRSNSFFNDYKYGKGIYKLLGGKPFNASKVEKFLDAILDKFGDQQGIRIWERIGKNVGLDVSKYDDQPVEKFETALIGAIGDFYNTHIKESIKEDEFDEARQAAIESSQKAAGIKEVKNRDIRTALKQDAKGTDVEIDSYFTSLMKAGDTFDTMEDYVEDFQNYIADKSLQEHFKRFI